MIKMNSYQSYIESYKQILENNRKDIDREHITSEIKALEPFAERTDEEIIKMFDSGAFRDILKAYCKKAMQNCKIDDTIDRVMSEIKWLLDTEKASQIIK